jgi:hypothetical protein
MAKLTSPSVSEIVLPASKNVAQRVPSTVVTQPIRRPIYYQQTWAPAWFYSALNWLGKSYQDAGNVTQRFGLNLVGSDVDPYRQLGSTRLFVITLVRDELFRLSLASDANSLASLSAEGALYPNTDAGITDLYTALSESSIFSAVNYCYIPGQLGGDLSPAYSALVGAAANLSTGYDPATGLRCIVLGSAVSQVVPLDNFLNTHNVQIYDESPEIVPLVEALVYDVTENNSLGAKTFYLPTFYTRDQVTPGNYYVSSFGAATATGSGNTVDCGQTVVFPGGPAYNDAAATALNLQSTLSATVYGGDTVTTYTFDTATVVSTETLQPKMEAGVFSLTYSGSSPATIFSGQQIIGFYRENAWKNCLGLPIYDYGANNSSFTAAAATLNSPNLIYDPTAPFLNGGSLQNVVRNLSQATYLLSPDRLVSLLDDAISAKGADTGVGLSVTTCALDFDLSSTPAAGLVDHLAVPVIATVTTTPPAIAYYVNGLQLTNTLDKVELARAAAAPAAKTAAPPQAAATDLATGGVTQKPISVLSSNASATTSIGGTANNPTPVELSPVTIQVGLSASIPQEALSGTGITGIEIGTRFTQQALGAGAAFQASPAGTIVNLMASSTSQSSIVPYDLATGTAGVSFTEGVSYVLSLTGEALTIRGSDGSTATSVVTGSTANPAITFVGSVIFTSTTASIPLYPKLSLTLPAPAVGSHGVQQGVGYSIRLTVGARTSLYDIVDATQTVLDANISVPNPTGGNNPNPQQGEIYFGSFLGGEAEMTVWSVPVFLTVVPAQLTGASFNGAMTLDSQASGVPDYQLQITDSSLFVYSNINVDSGALGTPSANNVFLSSAVINSSPDDASSKAFAPCKLLMGLIRQAQMGPVLRYVFVPEDDSVVIGGTRYMLSVINLDGLTVDPNSRPYPPVFWPQTQYWQFANRHNPYIDVGYVGATQADRLSRAQSDTARIGLATSQAQEPMQMYLDTDSNIMTLRPIFEFPLDTATQAVDQGQLTYIANTILDLLSITFPETSAFTPSKLDAEKITVPAALQQNNPYTAGVTAAAGGSAQSGSSAGTTPAATQVQGKIVTNLAPNAIATNATGIDAITSQASQQQQESNAAQATTKIATPQVEVVQSRRVVSGELTVASERRDYQTIYGFSLYNSATGEAYLIELVDADLDIPDQIPYTTENANYDPFYVRVVFLNTLTCYNMSIIVPSMVHDQYGHFAHLSSNYQNILSKTNQIELGYLYSIYDSSNNFDSLNFSLFNSQSSQTQISASQSYVYTNLPYATQQTAVFNPGSLFAGLVEGSFVETEEVRLEKITAAESKVSGIDLTKVSFQQPPAPLPFFVCRRQNWSAECMLMQATQLEGSSVFLAFGGGDLIPIRLDGPFTVDNRQPAYLYKLTKTFSDRDYDSVRTLSIGNVPYVIGMSSEYGYPQFFNFSIDATAGTAELDTSAVQALQFPPDIYVVGQASTTQTSVASLQEGISDTGSFMNRDKQFNAIAQQYQVIAYNNLVYLIRVVSNATPLEQVGKTGVNTGLLIDTFVPSSSGNLMLAQGARYKRSGLQFFGSNYTPTTMVDSIDTLDFTSITNETFYAPTIFIPIPEIDSTQNFVADLSNFLGQQLWTFIYSEIVAQPGDTVNGVAYPNGYNLDVEGKPVLSLQKLHFIYDPLAVLFTPNDLAHKYPLQPKQQILALTNSQIQEGICWRTANTLPQRLPPTNVNAQQLLTSGPTMDAPNIVYGLHNRPVITPLSSNYMGMSVNSIQSLSGVVYKIEESALSSDQVGTGFISAVSSTNNMLIGLLFDYDNNDLGTLAPYDATQSTKGIVFLNGYLSAAGYTFSSPDHFDVNDVLPSQIPLLEQIAGAMPGLDVAFYNPDVSLPRQYWSLVYDSFTGPGLPNFIPNVPPSIVDPAFTNRTRSLILSVQNSVRPTALGLMDTYSSVVSANLHLQNGVTGSVFLSKKADRDVASIGSNPAGSATLFGLPAKYDFFIFSRDHYTTLKDGAFELIDQGYAMCLVDDGSGTGSKIASYYVDSDGNYNELYTYVLYSESGGVIETNSFPLKVTLGAPANLGATPVIPETPNNVNPQDLVAQINKLSNLIYAAMGPSSPGQPPAYIPIQAVGGAAPANPIMGAPGFNGYTLNVMGAGHQPVQISQIYSGSVTYAIAGSTTIIPVSAKTGKAVPFYGSISHGLDKQTSIPQLQLPGQQAFIPRILNPASLSSPPSAGPGVFGGNGLGGLINTQFSRVFQGAGAVPPALATNPTPGTTMKADDTVYYTFNAVNNAIYDSTGKTVTASGGQYFIDATDPANPIYVVVTLPKFSLNGNTYNVNLSTTLSDGITSRYSLIVGGKSYQFEPDNAHVTADRTVFTFQPITSGIYTVTYADIDAPLANEAPSPITLTPFTITAGGSSVVIDVFNHPAQLTTIVTGVVGHDYAYDPVHGVVTITQNSTSVPVPLQTGLVAASYSGYGYVISFSNLAYSVNGSPMFPYSATMFGSPASYALMTAPQIFTLGGNFYTFNQDLLGNYLSVTGNGQTYPINPYQFSINGAVYIINTNVQPNTVVGGGNTYSMTAGNTQFLIDGVQYTITLKGGSLNGATIAGQYNITQANVVVIENYVYQLDTLNGQIVGNGSTYPLTTSGFTYTITTANSSFTVTTEPNSTTVSIGNIEYLINNTTVVGDGVTYPILAYRTLIDGASTFNIGFDGTVSVAPLLSLSAATTPPTFTDGATTYTVNALAAFDGTNYYPITGTALLGAFTTFALTYSLRTDGASIAAGPGKTYIVQPSGPLNTTQISFGSQTIYFGRPTDIAAFDGQHYYAIANNQFTDSNTGLTYTLSGNTAVNQGNSYEIYSNLGAGSYFEVPGGPTYYVNIAVADLNTASGDIYSVFPITANIFTIPLQYTVTVSGSEVTVASSTFGSSPVAVVTLTESGGQITGGSFVDPVTNISYLCLVDGATVSFIDSSNTIYLCQNTGSTYTFVASVVVTTAVSLAIDSQTPANVYPVLNGQFVVGAITYTVNTPVACSNAAGPYWPMVNGRFIVPSAAPVSSLAYTVNGNNIVKGYVISNDDQFSVDGNTVYTVNAVNVVKATNQATLGAPGTPQSLTAGALTYSLNSATSLATIQPAGLNYNSTTGQFTVSYNGVNVTYTVTGTSVTDSRHTPVPFVATVTGSELSFTDQINGVSFSFDDSGNNPITVGFPYTNQFFIDLITGVTYYIDETDNRVEVLSYLPETTQYAFVPADGKTYLIHYSNVGVVFPVISGPNVNAGVSTVGSDTFTVHIDQVNPTSGGAGLAVNSNSFEVNGNLYTIAGTPSGADYSSCHIVGDAVAPIPFLSASTFRLTDPSVTYSLQLDANNLPISVTAVFVVQPSKNIISVNDDVYVITDNTVSTGSLLGQGKASIAITGSSFKLTNPFDSTVGKFTFADLNIYDAASVVGQFSVYLSPTFFMGNVVYTLDPVRLSVTDNNKRPYPLLPNPTIFSINGYNYVIDSNRTPHAVVGNNNVSPLSTDVTVQSGMPVANSTFTLGGLIYKYTEDASGNLLTVTGTKSYMIAQPGLTFKLDSSLVFTILKTPPAAGNYAGSVVPIGTVTAAATTSTPTILNLYAGVPQSGNADFFLYKNVMYTLLASEGKYVSVQKSFAVFAAMPTPNQQQLAVFNLNGNTYMVTDGTTAGAPTPSGINPGNLWAATAIAPVEAQFGLVYGFTAQPINVTQSPSGAFQFMVTDTTGLTTLYDILYNPGSNANVVKVDLPTLLPTFMQTGPFTFVPSAPLTFQTGGYNAFTTFVAETVMPSESFAASYKTPVTSSSPLIDTFLGPQGDFSLEFWHSLPLSPPSSYHPFTYSASTNTPVVYYVDVDFELDAHQNPNIYLGVNNTVMTAAPTPPVISSGWEHFALSYVQPYTIVCNGGAGFEVAQGKNFNFTRDFSIAMTFSVSDVNTAQGLLYKGTASGTTSPYTDMSYRVGVANGSVTLQIKDGTGTISPVFTGPPIQPNLYYQLIIVKNTTSPTGNEGSADPYAPPFDVSVLGPATSNGTSFNASALPTQASGSIKISSIAPNTPSATPALDGFLTKLQNLSSATSSYTVTISIRTVNDDGTFGSWTSVSTDNPVPSDTGLIVNSTGSAHLLIGQAYDDNGTPIPPSGSSGINIRDVYLFNTSIDADGITTSAGTIDIANANLEQLNEAGILGFWQAQYNPSGIVNNPYDESAVAISTNNYYAYLAPLTGHEFEGTTLYIDGVSLPLTLVPSGSVPASWTGYTAGSSQLDFNAGLYKLQEISIWQMARQAYQIIDDMFGQLIPSNEPTLVVYLNGSFVAPALNAAPATQPPLFSPDLSMKKYIDNITVSNGAPTNLAFSNASLDLSGCPAVGRCGPLVTPNLYTPPDIALTVCDTPPGLTTYSVTLNTTTGTLAGEINEAYVYIKDSVLTLYAGKKVGDLVLSWVSQEQGNVQILGYIEGAPPAPMANLTLKPTYAGATSVTFTAPTSVTMKYQESDDSSSESKFSKSVDYGAGFGFDADLAPIGFGVNFDKKAVVDLTATYDGDETTLTSGDTNTQKTSSAKLDESNKYTLKMQGTLMPYTNDQFMASLNALTTPSNTAGTQASKTAILPDPNLGGFTTSNPPGQLPKTAPTEEKFGQRMYIPSPYGTAFVTSQTLDVYQQTLLQTNTVYGFVRIPNTQIPRDLNIVSFRMSSKYLRPGVLDGVVGYAYNPATLPNGAQTYTTSTGQMQVVYDGNFSAGEVGHDASYMRIVEAYQIKKQIDQQSFNSLAIYQTAGSALSSDPTFQNGTPMAGDDTSLLPGLDFYNEYVWSSRGGAQEVKHTYTTTYDEVYATSNISSDAVMNGFNLKLSLFTIACNGKFAWTNTTKSTAKYSYNTTGTQSFDIAAAFDGLETDTQMRYSSSNDAHFVMNFNSMFNPDNQSGLNLVIGSDGLVYNIVPSVSSGAGLPISDNIDSNQTFMQPQPAYATGNADGLTGNLEPYDRPGKVSLFRTYAFFLQPSQGNADEFWNTVIDPVWLLNSPDADADAMRSAQANQSIPWRLLYRVTYTQRFLPPVANEAIVVPQIKPLMAVPVLNPASDFLFNNGTGSASPLNPANDIENNIVLAAPTVSGLSAGTVPLTGPNTGTPVLANNVIPFDLLKNFTTVVDWGDTVNAKLIAQLTTSALGLNIVPMSAAALPGSLKVADVMDPVSGGPLYTIYTDPNGLTVNVPVNPGVTVYQDVNSNPIQYYDGKSFISLQSDYIASTDGTVMYYIQPPSTYDQSAFNLLGDYDLFGHPGDEWRYYLVSGESSNMTSEPTVSGQGVFLGSSASAPYTGFKIAESMHGNTTTGPVQGYVLVQGILQWPNLNTNAETFADVLVYKAMSLLDTFPIGDPEVLISWLAAQYPSAPFAANDEINLVFARNIVTYFNSLQQALIPQ